MSPRRTSSASAGCSGEADDRRPGRPLTAAHADTTPPPRPPARRRKTRTDTSGTREAGGQCPEEAAVDAGGGQRLPRAALQALPQGEGAAAPLVQLRLPGPAGAQGRLPAALDHPDQRGRPGERDDV